MRDIAARSIVPIAPTVSGVQRRGFRDDIADRMVARMCGNAKASTDKSVGASLSFALFRRLKPADRADRQAEGVRLLRSSRRR
jgi:hypothetical protein